MISCIAPGHFSRHISGVQRTESDESKAQRARAAVGRGPATAVLLAISRGSGPERLSPYANHKVDVSALAKLDAVWESQRAALHDGRPVIDLDGNAILPVIFHGALVGVLYIWAPKELDLAALSTFAMMMGFTL